MELRRHRPIDDRRSALRDDDPLSTWLIPLDSADSAAKAAVESFIATVLAARGHWQTVRESDGIKRIRIVSDGPALCRIVGEIWTIDQTVHVFWLDLSRVPEDPGSIRWKLLYDLRAPERRSRQAIDLLSSPEGDDWAATLKGVVT